jgi:hypothetical protein
MYDAWPPPEPRPRRRGGTGTALSVMATVVVLALVVGFGTSGVSRAVRSMLGLGDQPLSSVPLLPSGEGTFSFLSTQPGDPDAPVAYSPCEPIEVVVNPEDAPDDHRELVETAMAHVAEPSGLQFELVGETDERPSEDRPGKDPGRYGNGWSPVLVAWADSDEVPELAGDVAGLGGSLSVSQFGRARYVTGSVTLDETTFDRLWGQPRGRRHAQAIVDHEFGHLVGLGHVDDGGELMAADNHGRLDWGPGDLAGLSRLGRGRCP